MPFFEGCKQFTISGGQFHDVGGNMTHYDNSQHISNVNSNNRDSSISIGSHNNYSTRNRYSGRATANVRAAYPHPIANQGYDPRLQRRNGPGNRQGDWPVGMQLMDREGTEELRNGMETLRLAGLVNGFENSESDDSSDEEYRYSHHRRNPNRNQRRAALYQPSMQSEHSLPWFQQGGMMPQPLPQQMGQPSRPDLPHAASMPLPSSPQPSSNSSSLQPPASYFDSSRSYSPMRSNNPFARNNTFAQDAASSPYTQSAPATSHGA